MFTQRSRYALLAVAVIGLLFAGGRAPRASEVTVLSQRLLNAASSLNTASIVGASVMPRCRETAIYIVWGAGVTAGAVITETAHDAAYTGTWAPLATVNWTAASKQDIVQVTGVHLAMRSRVSTAIVNGTVSTWFVCN